MPSAAPLVCFAVAAPGLEPLVAAELEELRGAYGIEPEPPELGGVTFRASIGGVAAANLHLRIASRVLVRIGGFHARAFGELERRAAALPWDRFLAPGRAVHFRVSSRKSRLYHQDAIAERLASVVARRAGAAPSAAAPDGEGAAGVQEIVVRCFRDECTVSADSSGELLHRRGYRLATSKAPLRETLAAAMLRASGWHPEAPLVDPMCGSGTIPIEAALIARRLAPGLHRRFAVLDWPGHDAEIWRGLLAEARERALARAPAPIIGSDRDAGAIASATANAGRAGVGQDIVWRRAVISAIEPPAEPGWVVTNPPYGIRVGERHRLRDLYAQLGNTARRRLPGWELAFLSAHAELDRQTQLPLSARLATENGGLRVRLMHARVPGGAG